MAQINEEKMLVQWQSKKEKYLTDLSLLPEDYSFIKEEPTDKREKITLQPFLLGFILMLLKGGNSLNHWAMEISSQGGFLLAKQGLAKKLHMALAYFMSQLLVCVLRKRLQETADLSDAQNGLLSSFTNVFIEDSTCISLPDNLSDYFKSSYSKAKEAATARLQVCMNLKSHVLAHITLQSYRDNDQKHASKIVPFLKKGDLLIRDLGYAVLSAFKAIISVEAFFLSRLRSDVFLYLPGDTASDKAKEFDLYQYLLNCDKKGQNQVDIAVLAGKKEKLPVRLVAIKLPQKVADERRRKANLNRDKRVKPTEAYVSIRLGYLYYKCAFGYLETCGFTQSLSNEMAH
jgi:hypothetical protein